MHVLDLDLWIDANKPSLSLSHFRAMMLTVISSEPMRVLSIIADKVWAGPLISERSMPNNRHNRLVCVYAKTLNELGFATNL